MRIPPQAPFHAPVAQSIERRASNAEAGGESPSGSANQRSLGFLAWASLFPMERQPDKRPGLVANEIVPPSRGMRSMSSAFRHFLQMTLSSNWPRHPTFYRVIAGSNPARVANFHAHVAQQQRHDVESVASAGAIPAMSTTFGPKLRQRSSWLLTGMAGCMSLWTDHFPARWRNSITSGLHPEIERVDPSRAIYLALEPTVLMLAQTRCHQSHR